MAEREADVNPFSYTEETLEEIEGALSHERLQPYLDAVGETEKERSDSTSGIRRPARPATARYKGLRSCSATRSIANSAAGTGRPDIRIWTRASIEARWDGFSRRLRT